MLGHRDASPAAFRQPLPARRPRMSVEMRRICLPLQLPGIPKSVLMAMADRADDNGGSCYPSIETLVRETCWKRTAVIAAIQYLEDHQLIRANRSNGRKTSYQILVRQDLFTPPPPVREANRSAPRTRPSRDKNQSVSRTQPVRQTDTNSPYPSLTKRRARARDVDKSKANSRPHEQRAAACQAERVKPPRDPNGPAQMAKIVERLGIGRKDPPNTS